MQASQSCKTVQLMDMFTEAVCSAQSAQIQLRILSSIKQVLIVNPNNYYHPYFGRVSFNHIYEFIIECLSRQHQPPVLNFMLHVLALMTKQWVVISQNLKCLYQGILSLFQQKSFCCENCFKFFTVLVETMQQQDSSHQNSNKQNQSTYSCMPYTRAALQNYFVNHLLNEMLAFANIFLDRSVVRNEQVGNKNNQNSDKKQKQKDADEHSSERLSRSMDKGNSKSNPSHDVSFIIEDNSEECELYKIEQPQPVILSILGLTRACLSYDFSQTARHWQESDYEPNKSPIILPTKYSKHCKFSEFDVFLKNENTTELLNYLFLVCSTTDLKLEILRILQSMARIHFRYFKNKTLHKVHLEDIGYAVANLLTGLDLNEPMSASMRSRSSKNGGLRSISIDPCSKLKLALSLGQTLNILLYHQPTFYLAEYNLFQLILEHVSTFIVEELLDPDNFGTDASIEGVSNMISRADICLLIETFMSHLPKLKGYFKNYVSTSENLQQKLNQMIIQIGEKYFLVLCLQCDMPDQQSKPNELDKLITYLKNPQQQKQRQQFDNLNENVPVSIPQESSNKQISNAGEADSQSKQSLKQSSCLNGRKLDDEEKDQTQTNWNIIKNKQTVSQQGQKIDNLPCKSLDKSFRSGYKNSECFIQSIVKQEGSIQLCRILLAFFRAYCPKHTYLAKGDQNRSITRPQTISANSNISYKTEGSCKKKLSSVIQKQIVQGRCNYQKWLTSWLCSFQHHFNITAGHTKISQQWELDLHQQLMKQLIEDLHFAIVRYQDLTVQQNEDEEQLQELADCIQTILLYIADKIVYDSRCPSQEYLMGVELRVDLVVLFLCQSIVGTTKRINYDICKKTILQPVVDLLDTIDFHNYLLALKQGLADSHVRSLTSYCRNLQHLVKTNVSIQGSHQLISKMLYILLKISVNIGGMLENDVSTQLVKIFQCSPLILLNLLNEIDKSNGHRVKAESLKIYQTYLQGKVLTDWQILHSVSQKQYLINYLNCVLVQIRIDKKIGQLANKQIVTRKLWDLFQFIKDYFQNQDKNTFINCQCNLLLSPLLQITKQICSISYCDVGQLWNTVFSIIHMHTDCLIKIELPLLVRYLDDFLSIIPNSLALNYLKSVHESINHNNENLQLASNKNWMNYQLFVQSCLWIFKVLSLCRSIYSRDEPKLVNLQKQITNQIYEGYGKLSNSHMRSGLIRKLSQIVAEDSVHPNLRHALNNSLNLILTQTLKYLLRCMHEQIYLSDGEFSKINCNFRKCSFLKVDNVIEVFSNYHHQLQTASENHPEILASVIDDSVVRDCVKFCREFGVGWVVRKLQNWNNTEQLYNLQSQSSDLEDNKSQINNPVNHYGDYKDNNYCSNQQPDTVKQDIEKRQEYTNDKQFRKSERIVNSSDQMQSPHQLKYSNQITNKPINTISQQQMKSNLLDIVQNQGQF